MGFHHFVGVDGCLTMLELAKKKGLYQQLKQCLLGRDEISVEAGNTTYHGDAVNFNILGFYGLNITDSFLFPHW